MLLPTFFTARISCEISKTAIFAFEKKRENVMIEDAGMTIGEMLKKLTQMRPQPGKKLSLYEYRELKNVNRAFKKLITRYHE